MHAYLEALTISFDSSSGLYLGKVGAGGTACGWLPTASVRRSARAFIAADWRQACLFHL